MRSFPMDDESSWQAHRTFVLKVEKKKIDHSLSMGWIYKPRANQVDLLGGALPIIVCIWVG